LTISAALGEVRGLGHFEKAKHLRLDVRELYSLQQASRPAHDLTDRSTLRAAPNSMTMNIATAKAISVHQSQGVYGFVSSPKERCNDARVSAASRVLDPDEVSKTLTMAENSSSWRASADFRILRTSQLSPGGAGGAIPSDSDFDSGFAVRRATSVSGAAGA
jgi:hypothetical protein